MIKMSLAFLFADARDALLIQIVGAHSLDISF